LVIFQQDQKVFSSDGHVGKVIWHLASRQPPTSADNPFKTAANLVILIQFIIFASFSPKIV
jgi:hypothetical protein